MRLAFVTNNAARPPHVVADHLNDLGIAARVGEIVTSAQAAARHLADRLPGGASVLVVGTTGLDEALRERGLNPVGSAEGQVDAVVQGYSPEMNWRLLAEGAIAINRGVPWVATNIDPTVPSPRGPLPGNGSLVAALRCATRRDPVVTGKPDPTMHRESVLRSQRRAADRRRRPSRHRHRGRQRGRLPEPAGVLGGDHGPGSAGAPARSCARRTSPAISAACSTPTRLRSTTTRWRAAVTWTARVGGRGAGAGRHGRGRRGPFGDSVERVGEREPERGTTTRWTPCGRCAPRDGRPTAKRSAEDPAAIRVEASDGDERAAAMLERLGLTG